MIAGTYAVSAVLLAVTGYLFAHGHLTATDPDVLWALIFSFASAAASSAYLTVSEIFPLEMRGMAIALFYSVGTAVGGTVAPWLFGQLIDTGAPVNLFYGYLVAAAILLATVVVVAALRGQGRADLAGRRGRAALGSRPTPRLVNSITNRSAPVVFRSFPTDGIAVDRRPIARGVERRTRKGDQR